MGYLHCQKCDDFVYHPELEKLRAKARALHNGRRNMKISYHLLILDLGNRERDLRLALRRPSFASPRGLYNLGHTCYVNVILQTIVHHPLISNYFLQYRHEPRNCDVRGCIACAMGALLKAMLKTTHRVAYAPTKFIHSSWLNIPVYDPFYVERCFFFFNIHLESSRLCPTRCS